MAGEDQQYDATQLDEVQHPTLGPLKFPKDMPFEERNQHIEKMLADQGKQAPKMAPGSFQARKGGPILNANESALHTGIRGIESMTGSLGEHGESPNTIGEAFGNAGTNLGKLGLATLKDPFTPLHTMASGIEGAASDIEAGLPKMGGINPAGHPGGGIGWQSIAHGAGASAGTRAATEAIGRPIEAVAERAVPAALGKITPAARQARSLEKATKEMRTAAPPTRSEIDYKQAARGAAPFLAEEQRTQPIAGGKEAVRGSFEAANAAVQKIEAKTAEYAAAFPDETLSRREILDRVREKLSDPNSPRTPREIEAGVAAAAEFLPRDLNLAEADRLRWRMNRDTATEMGMTEADRADVRASNPKFAAKEELGNALRDGFYGRLEEKGVGGVRELREGEGNVLQMRDAFRRNINRSESPNPPSSFRRIGVFGPIGLGFLGETLAGRLGLPPYASATAGLGGAALYEYLRHRSTPGPTMERAFGRLGRSRLRPNYPEVPPQQPTEAIGTPIEPTTPNEPPNAGETGGNEPLTPQPEAGYTMREEHGPLFRNQGIGEPIQARGEPESSQEMDIRRSGPYQGEERRIAQEPIEEERRGPFAPGPPKQPQVGTPELLAAERERGQSALAAEREEPEAVETKVKGITAEEPKARAKREVAQPVEKLYSPDEITDAEGLINSEVGAMQSGERPGRYFDESTEGTHILTGNQRLGIDRAGGSWRGVKSGRDMFPFMREHPDWSPTQLEKALRNKDSALYKKAIGAAVEFIRREDEAERAAIQEESKASIAGEPIFPGMGRAMAEQAQGAAQVRGEELTRRMNEPRSIESAAGEMETKSPLFRGTAASPQNEMFGQPIEPEVMPRPGMAEFLRSGGQGERPTIQGPQGTIERLQFHRQNITNLEERLREETQAGQREDAAQTRRELEEEREFMRRAQQGVQTQP